ncbi:mycothione reductase [Aestuariimicrobium sp. T2.26MG-19.2B]|uniref:mycothione reductase n=1 Tax=Aestuariimicrobium sp. T2.26MG-19.2B TaxID=3040679 RepID=UPI0024777A34|nr:mycothione reductase [Aestuariimicrobium sp. T2.26MG-19.2B]CAI9405319.1 Mycothione reductase [Aestuariimicrobium sp. T2.26MG-19.2B]
MTPVPAQQQPAPYDLCVIGSGSGNSLLDERFSGLRVALVDEGVNAELGAPVFGGTCLNVGCIPTKMFVLPADLAASPHEAHRLGVDLDLRGVRFDEVRDRIFGRIDAISTGGLQWREQQSWVDVYRQHATFVDAHTLRLADGTQVRAEQFVLAAGSRPHQLEVPGFDEAVQAGLVHTSNTVMRIPALPRRIVILGAGFVAAEFAHVFASFGAEVTLVHRGDRLLKKADETISHRFTAALGERVTLQLNQQVVRLERVAASATQAGTVVVVTTTADGTELRHEADLVLNSTGRVSNSDRLEVGRAGVDVDAAGYVVVDEYQRTSVDHIWALGDICSRWQLKHVANHEMRVVQHNLSHPRDEWVRADHRFVPCAVFSDPQIGQVGLTQAQLEAAGIDHIVKVQEYGDVAFGWALEDRTHCVKLLADPHTGQLLGAHVMGPQAASLVQLCVQAMSLGTDIETMARGQYWIHPALTEVIENALLGLVEQLPSRSPRTNQAQEG